MSGRFGPLLGKDGTQFRLWAPAAERVTLLLNDASHAMQPQADGWYGFDCAGAGSGTRYCFVINDDIAVPDPASQFQPDDPSGSSEVIDHDYGWKMRDWRGRPWHEAVILELHIGTFTPAGTFLGAIDKLAAVAAAGFTAIELMPVAEFAGRRNWGYDGVLLYAPDSAYGRPEDLKALIDAAHGHGLMVLLDVVYNHFGPEGNYLHRYAPAFFTQHHTTPWGDAIDYRVPEVRAFAVENALHWVDNYRFDGLRLDAVHAIAEPGTPSMLEQLSVAVGALAAASGRHIHLVLENDDNRASLIDPLTDPSAGRYRAQWNDDYHHAWHVLLTGESHGYYSDYTDDPKGKIVKCLAQGFIYQGEASPHRKGARRGESSGHLSPIAFVDFLQNHDQIGNRARGERLATLADPAAYAAALAVLLLAPMPPLMFMGEEWGARQPFPFFCDFRGKLAEAVRQGRRKEFAEAYADPALDVPDPLAEATFHAAVLDWSEREQGEHRLRLDLVQRLLKVRSDQIVPRLAGLTVHEAEADRISGPVLARWQLGDGSNLHLIANLADEPCECPAGAGGGDVIWGGEHPEQLPPWSVYWSLSNGGA